MSKFIPPPTPLGVCTFVSTSASLHREKTIIQKDVCTQVFTAALFTTARTDKQPRCPSTDQWIKKILMYDGILLSHEKRMN